VAEKGIGAGSVLIEKDNATIVSGLDTREKIVIYQEGENREEGQEDVEQEGADIFLGEEVGDARRDMQRKENFTMMLPPKSKTLQLM